METNCVEIPVAAKRFKHVTPNVAQTVEENGTATDTVDKNYFKSYADINIHEEMISDRVRTSTYRLAILKNYEAIRGKVVLDVGAGTGILSMFCIQAGARRVYAIEASDMAEQAEMVFKKNKASDRAIVLKGKVEDVQVPEQVDVIVSEWMGYFLLYETMLPSVLFARDKWLKKDGLMLPGSASLYLAPLTDHHIKDDLRFWDEVDDIYEVDMSCLKPYASKCLVSHVNVHQVEPQSIMAHAAEICHFDLHRVQKEELDHVKGQFSLDCFGAEQIHGFTTWFDVKFNKDVILTTSPYRPVTHWQQCVLYLEESLKVEQGTLINGSIQLNPNKRYHRFLDILLQYRVKEVEREQKYLMDDFV